MNEPFVLEVNYQNRSLEFPAAFQRFGYTYRIVVNINEVNCVFEPDEEGNYRALGSSSAALDTELLRTISEKLKRLQV